MDNDHLSILLQGERGHIGEDALDALSLSRLMAPCITDTAEGTIFFDTLRHPPLEADTIRQRQQVLAELYEHPTLLREMTPLLEEFARIKSNWDAERQKHFTLRRLNAGDRSAELYNARLSLQLNARYLKITLLRLQAIGQLLQRYRLSAPWIKQWLADVQKATISPEGRRLYAWADHVECHILEAVSYTFEAASDGELRLCRPLLTDFHGAPKQVVREEEFSLSSLLRRPKKSPAPPPPPDSSTAMGEISADIRYALTMEAVTEADRRLTHAARALLNRFGSIRREISFYQCAIRYLTRMKERGIPLAYPIIREEEDGCLCIRALKDPLLLSEATRPESVIANDIDLCPAKGRTVLLIGGENSSGKTVYLRSVGTAVILGLSGLPIPALSGEVSIRRSLHTLFAAPESAIGSASAAGRFEEEAAAMAAMLAQVGSSSLILLNEVFQSTAYKEGAAGLLPILRHIREMGGTVLCVTHLTPLLDSPEEGMCVVHSSTAPGKRYCMESMNTKIGGTSYDT